MNQWHAGPVEPCQRKPNTLRCVPESASSPPCIARLESLSVRLSAVAGAVVDGGLRAVVARCARDDISLLAVTGLEKWRRIAVWRPPVSNR